MEPLSNKKTESYWTATTEQTKYAALKGKIEVDVAIVGGGITGLTAALRLKQAGKKVAVLERTHIASGDTGHTTAHLTEVIDTRYYKLVSDFGSKGARMAAESSRAAIDQIESWVSEFNIDCDFMRVPAYLYTESRRGVRELRKEARAMRRAGVEAEMTTDVPLPFRVQAAIRVKNQAQFHPRKYLLALAEKIHGDESYVFEKTKVTDMVEGDPCHLTTENGSVVAKEVIFATYSPINSKFIMPTKIPAYRTYAVAVKLRNQRLEPGLYWDTADPYHYTRAVNGELTDVLIIGGEDHKTGMLEDTESRFGRLAAYCRDHFDVDTIETRWSGQILEPIDGLPYIGLSPMSKHFYISTGYTGNGMTFGTIGGMLTSDLILGHKNKWADLYDASRVKPKASAFSFINENKDYPLCMIKDRIKPAEAQSIDEVKPGEGKIVAHHGEKVAVYHDTNGAIFAVSPVCTHMGCLVHFNNAEQSWDCPCHGSRFAVNGEVMNGPAVTALKPVDLTVSKPEAEKKKKTAARKKSRAAADTEHAA